MKFFKQTVLFEGGLAAVALILGFSCGLNILELNRCDLASLYYAAVLTICFFTLYVSLCLLPLECIKKLDRFVRELFWQEMGSLSILQLCIIAALAGLGEELFFRGLLQFGFTALFGKVWAIPILIIVSVIFALLHAVTKTYFVAALVISLYLGFLLVLTENIFIPIIIHAVYDLAVFLYLRLTPPVYGRSVFQEPEV